MNKKLVRRLMSELVRNHKEQRRVYEALNKSTIVSVCFDSRHIQILDHNARKVAQILDCTVADKPHSEGNIECGYDYQGVRIMWLEGIEHEQD